MSTPADGLLTVHLALTSAPSSPRIPLKISKDIPAGLLRSSASEATKIPLSIIKLIFRGRLIADSDRDAVVEFKLEDGCVVHCMGKPANEASEGTTSTVTANTTSPSSAGSSVSIPPGTAAAAAPPSASFAADSDPLKTALTKMKSECSPPSTYLAGIQTLDKILSNIESHPMEEKYRRVKRGNAAFQRRLGGIPGGHDAMLAAGFSVEHEGEGDSRVEMYKIVPSADAWPKLVEARAKVGVALIEAQGPNSAVPGLGQPAAGGVLPVMPGMEGMPPMMPGMEEAASAMLSDPNSLQRMLQNPMVQNMMRNDPRFANNPQMAAQMEALMSDPNMVHQMSQMMSDPAMRQQMMQMSRSMGGMGGNGFGGMGGAGPSAVPGGEHQQQQSMDPSTMEAQMQMLQQMMGRQPQQAQQAGGGAPPGQLNPRGQGGTGGGSSEGGNDQEMTEEEMIQEAIRRSMQDS
mmetsp:Transcript_46180/g.139999  ORF Transcript_46180/g.139999 Transcript_46180/m.139999 type:complete len:461 (-) Transcript_46180:44-1426(-)|eukprot:CAMPEP_0113544344 /NCGR_PEP_ID=MMETSP0015_2-20120614/10657_1 /TAXON_ID=2838 /ORGANISM="Odontella" /LENGTH=460 /DNA_ID=CAMNT_0000444595 /DNA_START=30 /DNA_END=1412 /DNA_ORIENTATION=- /assembly_acc=CAM_ASM_000160